MPTVAVNLDTTQYVQVNNALNPLVLQALNDSVRITLSELKPAKSNIVFHLLAGKDAPLHFPSVDTNVWALAITDKSSLIVTDAGSLKVVTDTGESLLDAVINTNYSMIGILSNILNELKIMNTYNAMTHDEELLNEDLPDA